MSSPEPKRLSDIKVDAGNLYREETYTDLKVATIQRLVPVNADGSPDESREPMFMGQTHVMTSAGPVPVQAPLEAKSLEEAVQKFPEAVRQAVEKMVDEVRELQRQAASRIVVPQAGTMPPGTGGPGGGGGGQGGPGGNIIKG
ncbi:MAG: hypothetical protein ACLF0G_14760 [Candidatus Brocadiia bacterium]